MDEWDMLIEVLERSVKHNGEKPLTNLWLLNLLKHTRNILMCGDDVTDGRNI